MWTQSRIGTYPKISNLVLAPLAALASTALLLMAVVMGFASPASAQEIDVDFCTNFYPELCLGPDGEIDPDLFPYLIDGTPIPGYTDPAYDLAVLALERHRGGDDLDGNGVPDSPEIAVCGEAGCLPEAMAESEVTEPDALVINMCKGNPESASSVEVDISEGMNPKKLVSVFTLSSPTVNYMGSYPESGKVKVTVGPGGLEFGTHRVVAVGTADGLNEAEIKVWRLDVNERFNCSATTASVATTRVTSQVQGSTQTAGTSPARTGASIGAFVGFGAAVSLLGSAMLVGLRRRRAQTVNE